jgi:hypothetical protein
MHDFVSVAEAALLDGQLKLKLIDDFTPAPTDTFTVFATQGGIAGVFSNIFTGQRLSTIDGDGSFLVHYGATSAFSPNQIVLTAFEASPPLLPGDYNADGTVDAADYAVWRDNEGTISTLPNDPIGGTIGQAQYDQWRVHFGQTSGSRVTAAVPEPTFNTLLITAMAGVSFARRGRQQRWHAYLRSFSGAVARFGGRFQ